MVRICKVALKWPVDVVVYATEETRALPYKIWRSTIRTAPLVYEIAGMDGPAFTSTHRLFSSVLPVVQDVTAIYVSRRRDRAANTIARAWLAYKKWRAADRAARIIQRAAMPWLWEWRTRDGLLGIHARILVRESVEDGLLDAAWMPEVVCVRKP